MKLRRRSWFLAMVCGPGLVSGLASAGGLLLPGAGPVSTSRAGAAVASTDDGEAMVINPAGLAKTTGTTITLSAAMIQYAMEFQRRGSYDAVPMETYPYAGQPYPLVRNDSSPQLGIGSFEAIPMLIVTTDLGRPEGRLRLAAGLYAPNGYPFRDMCTELAGGCSKYVFNDNPNLAPPPTRYDIMKQEVTVIAPSIAASYRILPQLDVGLRLTAAYANLKSTAALWGIPDNFQEDIKRDGTLAVDASDSFVPAFDLGVSYRPTPNLEFAANYMSSVDVHAKGTAVSRLGPSVTLAGASVVIGPRANAEDIVCEAGGTQEALKACADTSLPQQIQIGGRYKFLDAAGKTTGDIELDLGWENWGHTCSDADFTNGDCVDPSNQRLSVDADAYVNGNSAFELNQGKLPHGFQDTYAIRLGGSYRLGIGAPRADGNRDEIIVRGGLGYDTAAARTGWLRADIDGAARTTIALGGAYRAARFEINLGFGAILEGSPSNPNVGGGAEPCNPTSTDMTCNGSTDHQGVDPTSPLVPSNNQRVNPVAQGDYKSHYLMFLLGASTWF